MNQQRDNLGMVNDAEQIDYNRYLTQLGQYNTDRNFAYGQYTDDRNWDYTLGRDQIEDSRYQNETDYNRALYQAETMAQYGDFSGYRALGFTESQIAAMQADWQRQQLASASSGRSSSGDRSSSTSGSGGQDYEGLFAAAEQSGYPKSFISNNYKKYGFTSSSGLYDGFEDWAEGGGDQEPITSYSQLGTAAKRIADGASRGGASDNIGGLAEQIETYLNRGEITDAEADFLLRAFGY